MNKNRIYGPGAKPKLTKNPFGKTRHVTNPYAIYRNGSWEWRVLKTYQRPDKEAENKHARWLCAVKSPATQGVYEFGDVYVRSIQARLVSASDEWRKYYK